MCAFPRRFLALAAIVILCISANGATASDEYFMLMFGSQRVPANPNYSHTSATFVKVSWPVAGAPGRLSAATVSWLPANLKIRTSALLPEPGQNFDLPTSLAVAYRT